MWKTGNIGIQVALAVDLTNALSGDLSARVNRFLKTIGGLISLLIASLSASDAAQSATLAWDRNLDPDIAGYRLHYGTESRNPSHSLDVGNVTTATASDLGDGSTYFFAVTAYDSAGLESEPSNEVSAITAPLGAHTLTVRGGSGSGQYTESTRIPVSANATAPGQQFDRWTGDYQILDNPLSPTTTALMLFRDLTISASYRTSDTIRFLPLAGYTTRMAGGVFEGTDADPVNGPYTAIYTITKAPPAGWSEVAVGLGSYRYLRYRGAPGSYCTVAEIQFYRAGAKLAGTGYGSPGSWLENGATFDKALDGNSNTFFNGPAASGNYVGIDTAAVANKIRYLPLAGYSARMVGGVFEGTNGNAVTGPYTPIYTITTAPPAGWSEVSVNLGGYRYLRYRGATGSYCTVAEIQFYRAGAKLAGTGYGSPGSWLNNGATFDKALDGNSNTFFNGPTTDGNYVGIDTAAPPILL